MKTLLRLVAAFLVLVGLASIGWYFRPTSDTGGLTWEPPVVKKSLMTFAYKIYGNPAAQNGRNFLSKVVFQNKGTGPVRDFSISYQIPDYIPWTTAETHEEIQPGQTVVKVYYPQLPSKVTQLSSQTTVTLETKIHWSDKPGSTKEEILRSNVELRGVNEVEYTDLPANEVVTWYDQWATAPFTMAMVTPNDPVVQEFVAEITRRTGGTTAGIAGGSEEVARVMKAVYDYMCETGMRYTSDAGVPARLGDISTTVQTVRLPRDVIITNQGLCIELALLWASVMEHLGLPATVVFVPGHAFTVVRIGQGPTDIIPIECTAITPMAVNSKTPLSFVDAVQFAWRELKEQKTQMWVGVQDYQRQGLRPPELPAFDIEKIKNILAKREAHRTAPAPQTAAQQPQPQPQQNTQPNPQPQPTQETSLGDKDLPPLADGFFRYMSYKGWVTVDVPANWTRVENGPIKGMIFTAQDAQTTVGVNVFQFLNLKTADEAMKSVQQQFSSVMGVKLRIASHENKKGNVIVYTGTALGSTGTNRWAGMFVPTNGGGVLGFFIGANDKQYTRNQKLIDYIVSTVYFGYGK
ncbi:MAG: hypothetical protein ABJF10_27515 [Chthoniobacter sp.]|uniref:hypothetical protein n=1 Tax=Chthoniobacter sp. TaxID=2510640 RepID=UPI0032A9AC9A